MSLKVCEKPELNPFLSNFEIKGSKVTKIKGGGLWHILKLEQVVPDKGTYTFSIKV